MLVSTREIFRKCYGRYGIAAVNVWSMEQVLALFRAAQKANAPVIVQTTPVAREYARPEMLLAMISAAARIYSGVVFAVHLDHGTREHALDAIDTGGYNSVMIDASHEPFDDNVAVTWEIVSKAHLRNIDVEAELGVLSGVEDDITVADKDKKFTQPAEVEDFVTQTGCDSLAVAVGTSHGAYKFSGMQGLQFNILREIQNRLPGFPLVLHGGSAVNLEEIRRINAAGGNLGTGARGVSDKELVKAIQYGVCKINIATDSRLIWTRVHREFFKNTPELFDPVVPGRAFMDAFEAFNLQKFELLNAIGKANEFK